MKGPDDEEWDVRDFSHLEDDDEPKPQPPKRRPLSRDEMDEQFPEYSQESRRAGNFLGLDFPYVPGDPGL